MTFQKYRTLLIPLLWVNLLFAHWLCVSLSVNVHGLSNVRWEIKRLLKHKISGFLLFELGFKTYFNACVLNFFKELTFF